MPLPMVTSLSFGGDDMHDVYMSPAREASRTRTAAASSAHASTSRAFGAARAGEGVLACVYELTCDELIVGSPASLPATPGTRSRMVPRGGIEPPTLRFSVACSTN